MGKIIDADDAIKAIQGLHRWILDPKGEFQPVEPPTKSMIDPDDAVAVIAKLQPVAVSCKDCKYAIKADQSYWLCGHPSNNAWNIYEDFFCGRGVRSDE